jgi:L-lactate dehydrogenase complex protein LldF
MKVAGKILASAALYDFAGAAGRWAVGHLPKSLLYMPLNVWGKGRELPTPPKESFKQWYKANRK